MNMMTIQLKHLSTNPKLQKFVDLKNCVLLDSQSTVQAFCNKAFVDDIWTTSQKMIFIGNGFFQMDDQMGAE